MVKKVYYRTPEAFLRDPLALGCPDCGPDKSDYVLVTEVDSLFNEDEIFRMMNVVDGDELPVRLGVRSMSVGDVIVDETGRALFCAGAGWEATLWRP